MPRLTFFQRVRQSRAFLLISLAIFVIIILYIVRGSTVFNEFNLFQILMNLSYEGLFVAAMACLLMSGGFDFSLASQATLGTLIFVELSNQNPDVSWIFFVILVIILAFVMGLVNAFFSQYLNLMPFICTIAMSSVWTGVSVGWTGGLVKSINRPSFDAVANARVFGLPIPWTFIFMLAVIIIYNQLIKRTRFGRNIMVAGGNPTAARLAGLNPKKIKTILYMNASMLGMLAGLVYTAQQRTATTTGLAQRMPEMRGLTSSMLGGVSFMGGAGGLTGAFWGLILISVLRDSLTLMNVQAWVVIFVNGMLLVVALTIDTMSTRIRMRKLGLSTSGGGGMVMPGMSR